MQADLEDPDAPYNGINYSSKKFPAFTPLGNGVCNSDLPNDSTLNRYLFVIQYYVSQVRGSACPVTLGSHRPVHARAWLTMLRGTSTSPSPSVLPAL